MFVLYRRRWLLFYLPVLLLAGAAVGACTAWVLPLPPRTLVLAGGVPQGGDGGLAEHYRDELESRGIATEILASDADAPARPQQASALADAAQAGFAHGLLAGGGDAGGVQALAAIGRQPVWFFVPQAANIAHPGMLRGLRIAAGPIGGTTQRAAARLLVHHQLAEKDVTWVPLLALVAADALLEQRVDAVATIGSSDAPTVRLLARSAGAAMLGMERAGAMAAREPRLAPYLLPQGAIELRGNVPPRDLTLLAAQTHLLVRESLHPALQRALLDAAVTIHAAPGFLQQEAEFPAWTTDFPLSPVARRYARGDRPWLEDVLPYWWAQLASLLLHAVLPIAIATALALRWIPRFLSVRVDAALSRHYGELKFLEAEIATVAAENPIAMRTLLQRLDRLEAEVAALDLPARYADRWYTLREHLWAARERLLKLRGR